MGVSIGWTLHHDIAPPAWTAITQDMTQVLEAYPSRMAAQRRAAEASTHGVLHPLSLAAFGPRKNDPGFARGLQGAGMDAARIEIMPSAFGRAVHRQDEWTWALNRQAGDSWCTTGAEPHTYLLFAAMALVDTHAPGLLTLTQDDIELEDDERTELQAWLTTVVGHTVAPVPRRPAPAKRARKPKV